MKGKPGGLEIDAQLEGPVLNVNVKFRQGTDLMAIESAVRETVVEAAQGYLGQPTSSSMLEQLRDSINKAAKSVTDTLEKKDGVTTWFADSVLHARCLYCAGAHRHSLGNPQLADFHRAAAARLVRHESNCTRKLVLASNEAAQR
jgi:uncharacterized protein YdbL (DUF1318 family)